MCHFCLKLYETRCTPVNEIGLVHRNRSDFCDLRLRGPSRTPEIARFPRQETAMMHYDLRVRWKVASDLRFRAAISEPKTPSFCGISGDLAPLTRKSLAIAIVRFWCAKERGNDQPQKSKEWSAPERDRNEIRTRRQFAYLRALRDEYTLGFSLLECQMP